MEPYAELKESHGISPASGVFDDLVPIALAFLCWPNLLSEVDLESSHTWFKVGEHRKASQNVAYVPMNHRIVQCVLPTMTLWTL